MQAGEAIHLVISGRVQGVGFRAFVAHWAAAGGVRGWVRNRTDGSVECVAIGSAAALADLVSKIEAGPPHGRVSAIARAELDRTEQERAWYGERFRILPTA